MSDNESPKIIVDDDWKAQAQAEKARLAEEKKAAAAAEKSAGASDSAAAGAGAAAGDDRKLPEANFSTIVTTMATQALFAMGAAPDPRTNQRYLDLDMAKFQIDCLAALQGKTEGNLTDEEQKLLVSTLYELRSHFIAITRQMTSQGIAGGGQG